MKHLNNTGQTVVIVLLVAVVAATIAFSIAGSSLKNIEQTATTEETNRAFSAAEAGIEEALYNLEQTGSIGSLNNTALGSGAVIKEVNSQDQVSLVLDRLEKDDVAQVVLNNTTTQIKLKWDTTTAMVITVIDVNNGVTRYASKCSVYVAPTFTLLGPVSGMCEQNISVTPDDRIVRMRAMYDSTSLSVTANNGTLPVQSTVITATGQSGETERTVQVERTVPVAPAFLDYVLFSASGSLSK
ncbi:hypothetical protein GW793_03215 [bacterium]|uniref:Type 4 fimbrial biogenesis protein PilX N-terminal domain-containing protein n=2 Tax=Katanobacteria TaxID=422282 RepID=A0A2M7X0C2_UNCKA|nr:hypothetical protein [bacterium]PIP56291.1 MAG: hypothetical protein COX05_03730 [candidate division WWE3 bacterium CG22_combo_CG10-13_8_21_14_all_39_12]PJA39498.1 MAG: hypothetical protein CO179_05055 [candidate division WWE3 bacterium CG_4_9_14_3_um_filter_39_7]